MPRSSKVTKSKTTTGRKTREKQLQKAVMMSTQSQDQDSPVYFWRETHPDIGYLSQWYDCPFQDPKDQSKIYKTAEHYMMHHKALLFNDTSIAAQVLSGGHPRKVKSLGRKVKNFNEDTWVAERARIVEEGNYAKFTCTVAEENLRRGSGASSASALPVSEGGLRALLLSTGERELVEASPFDRIWGVGFAEKDADDRRDEWGLNLLGKALMAVRDRFRREDEEKQKEKAEKK